MRYFRLILGLMFCVLASVKACSASLPVSSASVGMTSLHAAEEKADVSALVTENSYSYIDTEDNEPDDFCKSAWNAVFFTLHFSDRTVCCESASPQVLSSRKQGTCLSLCLLHSVWRL